LVLWSYEVFEEIGNDLNIFYEVVLSYRDLCYLSLSCILVGLDMCKEMVAYVYIRRGSKFFHLTIDYEGISFKCFHCHNYGHLALECSYTSLRKTWAHKK
jgi:hypothetical protein